MTDHNEHAPRKCSNDGLPCPAAKRPNNRITSRCEENGLCQRINMDALPVLDASRLKCGSVEDLRHVGLGGAAPTNRRVKQRRGYYCDQEQAKLNGHRRIGNDRRNNARASAPVAAAPTPRTDAFYDSFDGGEDDFERIIDTVFDFARQLETELAAANAKLAAFEQEPIAWLINYREMSKSGQPRNCVQASIENSVPTIWPDDDAESRALISATPLYARKGASK